MFVPPRHSSGETLMPSVMTEGGAFGRCTGHKGGLSAGSGASWETPESLLLLHP